MDPDACLEEIRKLVADGAKHGSVLRQTQLARLLELVQALDEWLSQGGFMPKDWLEFDPQTNGLRTGRA